MAAKAPMRDVIRRVRVKGQGKGKKGLKLVVLSCGHRKVIPLTYYSMSGGFPSRSHCYECLKD